MPDTNQTFDAALADFVAYITEKSDARYKTEYKNLTPPVYSLERGQKNVRIVATDGAGRPPGSRRVYGFVEIATGNILKSASWKAPAKGVRGNLYNILTWTCAGDYGIAYITGPGNYGGSFINTEEIAKTVVPEGAVAVSEAPRKKREPKYVPAPHVCSSKPCEFCMST